MLREIVRRVVSNLLTREVLRGASKVVLEWLNPCVRLTWARVQSRRHVQLGHDFRAGYWLWRMTVLERKCRRLNEGGLCAADLAERAAVEAITEAIAKKAWK
jgi:hypothetical protein